jgi:hypothetical protein
METFESTEAETQFFFRDSPHCSEITHQFLQRIKTRKKKSIHSSCPRNENETKIKIKMNVFWCSMRCMFPLQQISSCLFENIHVREEITKETRLINMGLLSFSICLSPPQLVYIVDVFNE